MAMFILWTFVLCFVSFSTCNFEVDNGNDSGGKASSADSNLDNTHVTTIHKDESSSTWSSTTNPSEHLYRVTLPTTTESPATGSLTTPYMPTTPMPYIPPSTQTNEIFYTSMNSITSTESTNDAGTALVLDSSLNVVSKASSETKPVITETLISTSAPIDEAQPNPISPISELPDTTASTSTTLIIYELQSTESLPLNKSSSNATEGVDNGGQPKFVLLPSEPTVVPGKDKTTTSKEDALHYSKFQYDAPTLSHATNSSKEYQQHENGKSSPTNGSQEQEIHTNSGNSFAIVPTEHAVPITDSSVVSSTTSFIPGINNDTTHVMDISSQTSLESSIQIPPTPPVLQEESVTEIVKKPIFNETEKEVVSPSNSKTEESTTNVKTTSGSDNQLSPPKTTKAQNTSESSIEMANNIEINTTSTSTPPTTYSPTKQSNLSFSTTSPANTSNDTGAWDSEKNNTVHQFFIDLRVHTVMCVISIFVILLTITVVFSFVVACVLSFKYMGIGLYKLGKNTQKCFQIKNSSTSNQESGSLFPRCDVAIRPYPQDDADRY